MEQGKRRVGWTEGDRGTIHLTKNSMQGLICCRQEERETVEIQTGPGVV